MDIVNTMASLAIRIRMSLPSCCKLLLFILGVVTMVIIWQNCDFSTIYRPTRRLDENHIIDFHDGWCRMQRWRVEWERVTVPCEGRMAWDQRQVDSLWRTGAKESFVSAWEIMPAGQFSRFFIQSVSRNGDIKKSGGDAWRVYIRRGPASLAPHVWDLNNGIYEVVFLVMEPGNYSAQITLDFTLCDGLRDPPEDWFIKGTIQGKYQAEGILGNLVGDYILEPLGGQASFNFTVPESFRSVTADSGKPTHGQTLPSDEVSCGISCSLLNNGFGRWIDGRWVPYIQGGSPPDACESTASKAQTLWIYGDSVNQRFIGSLRARGICKNHFTQCKSSHMWIYELKNPNEAKTKFEPNDFNKTIILKHISEILNTPDMKTSKSIFLFNFGVHFSVGLNFTAYKDLIDSVVELLKEKAMSGAHQTAIPVWKTTTAIEKENVHKMYKELPNNSTHWRFHTHQRLVLFHKFAVSAMCKAGIDVLDVYPMTASYPNGTLDHVHFTDNVQKAAEDQLVDFITKRIKCAATTS